MTAEICMWEVIQALTAAGVPYMVVGSLSSNVYGVPRSTSDADFLVETTDASIVSVMKHLGSAYVLDPQMSFEGITGSYRHRIRHVPTAFLVELFSLNPSDPHDKERFGRRRLMKFAAREVQVASAEDVIITKLRWSRHANRSKDTADIRSVISVYGKKIDWDYVHRWCAIHGTAELLQKIKQSLSVEF